MKRFGTCLLVLFVLGLNAFVIAGCGPACPIDTNADGVLSQQEIDAYQLPMDPGELVTVLLACQSLAPQLGL